MASAVQLQILNDDDRRRYLRQPIGRTSTLRTGRGAPVDVIVTELSRDGCQISCPLDLPLGTALSLGLAGSGVARGHVVRRVGDSYGCAFDRVLTPEQLVEAFGPDEIVTMHPAAPWSLPLPAPKITPWPAAVRVAALVGVTSMLWLGIFAIVRAL